VRGPGVSAGPIAGDPRPCGGVADEHSVRHNSLELGSRSQHMLKGRAFHRNSVSELIRIMRKIIRKITRC
jgi:hypothetical protein